MITTSLSHLKKELSVLPSKEIVDICMKLAKYKKENKELLHYLLYDAGDEQEFIATVKKEMTLLFFDCNLDRVYLTNKSIRKILKITNKYIKYSKQKKTEVELLIHFCTELKNKGILIYVGNSLNNLYYRQITKIKIAIEMLHEDLQHDYLRELDELV